MALNEIARHFYEKEVERLLGLDDVKIIKEKFLDMRSQIDDLYMELGERARRISKLEEENKEAKDKTHKLEVELAEKDAWFKIRGGLNAEPLPFSDEQYEEDKIAELEERISKIENFIQEQTEAEIKRLKAENKYMQSQIMQSEFVKGVIKS